MLEPVLGRVAPLFSELAARAEGGSADTSGVHNPFEPIFGGVPAAHAARPRPHDRRGHPLADPTSRDLIHYLARRLASEWVLLLVTFRTDELHPGHPVHRLAATLVRERLAERVELEPLSRDGVASMLAAMLEKFRGVQERDQASRIGLWSGSAFDCLPTDHRAGRCGR